MKDRSRPGVPPLFDHLESDILRCECPQPRGNPVAPTAFKLEAWRISVYLDDRCHVSDTRCANADAVGLEVDGLTKLGYPDDVVESGG